MIKPFFCERLAAKAAASTVIANGEQSLSHTLHWAGVCSTSCLHFRWGVALTVHPNLQNHVTPCQAPAHAHLSHSHPCLSSTSYPRLPLSVLLPRPACRSLASPSCTSPSTATASSGFQKQPSVAHHAPKPPGAPKAGTFFPGRLLCATHRLVGLTRAPCGASGPRPPHAPPSHIHSWRWPSCRQRRSFCNAAMAARPQRRSRSMGSLRVTAALLCRHCGVQSPPGSGQPSSHRHTVVWGAHRVATLQPC
jgi:hypothetical protein